MGPFWKSVSCCLNTLPVPIPKWDCPFRVRFVFAYGVDNSDRPSYLLWPCRGDGGHFWLVDPWSGNFFDPTAAKFIAPIGLEHFFDAFALNHMRPLRVDAAAALRLPHLSCQTGQSCDVSSHACMGSR